MFRTSILGTWNVWWITTHPIYPLVDNDLIGTRFRHFSGFFGGFDAEFLDQLRPQRAPWWLALAVLLALASFLAIGPFVGEVFTTLAANLMKIYIQFWKFDMHTENSPLEKWSRFKDDGDFFALVNLGDVVMRWDGLGTWKFMCHISTTWATWNWRKLLQAMSMAFLHPFVYWFMQCTVGCNSQTFFEHRPCDDLYGWVFQFVFSLLSLLWWILRNAQIWLIFM